MVTHRHNYIIHVEFQYVEIYRKESTNNGRKSGRQKGRQDTKKQQIVFEQRRSPSKLFNKLIWT